ncbi:hypothetical protein L2E82_19227 [Cichorium intybus]|uniref:Uncharacterized protein n=1 Tax=Cichorium intybus TaxID=13427 RepID=A0ACB9FCB6_CICIN|nr:hypothetical protein L2E82_19227 [Cichorium intybus]
MRSRAVHTSLSGDPVPYLTARVSHSLFFYTFKLHPGPKFIRLHFNPTSYIGFETSTDLFTVQAGPYKLLQNFSASMTAQALGVISFSKEFCISVEENLELIITVTPSNHEVYGFVNGIEIVSMPSGLYYTPEGSPGPEVVGPHRNKFYIDNTTALETVHRNTGGTAISPVEDTGLFRRWSKDSDYLSEKNKVSPVYHATTMIKWFWEEKLGKKTVPTPPSSGDTSRCFLFSEINAATRDFDEELVIGIGGFAKVYKGVIDDVLCGRPAVDPGLEEEQRSLALWARQNIREGKIDQIIDPNLRGEILPRCLKIFTELAEKCTENQPKRRPSMASVISRLEFAIEQQENGDWFIPEEQYVISPKGTPNKKSLKPKRLKSWRWDLLWNGPKTAKLDSFVSVSSSKAYDDGFRRFLLSEIHSATNDFDENLIVGSGDFSIVYKGYIDYGSRMVAMKRFKKFLIENWLKKTDIVHEFCKEIEMLAQIRDTHLVSLIGYCYHKSEMILVYEYMVGPVYAVSDNLTGVLGNCLGYLDPELMFANGTKPNEKSDVYSFGLVLLEVLCGRKLEDHTLQRDQVFLRSWVKSNIAKGTIHKTIDPSLKGKIAPESLKEFIKIADRCLADQSNERPSMNEVVKALRFAVQQQDVAKLSNGSSVSKNM